MKKKIETKMKKSRSESSPIFLSGLSPKNLKLLQGTSAYAEFGSGDVIFRQGSPANTFYLIEHGTVALECDMDGAGLVEIAVLNDGEPLGWSWLFPPQMWHYSARALKRTTTTCFDAKALREWCEKDHDFGYEIMQRVSQVMLQRLLATQEELIKLYGKPRTTARPSAR